MFSFFEHNVVLLFAHCTADDIRPAVGITRKLTTDLHNLFLIDHAAVSNFKNIFEFGCFIFDFMRIVSVFNISRNRIHRARSVKGNNRNQVFKTFGFELRKNTLHSARFKLKHAFCLRLTHHFIDRFIININVINAKIRLILLNHFFC